MPTERESQYINLGTGFDEVFTPLPKFTKMEEKRRKCRDLWKGIDALISQGRIYLPQKDLEKDQVYIKRLKHATLYNMFSRAVEGLVGRVFSKVLSVIDIPESNQPWFEDIDFLGNNLDMFAKDVFETAMVEGVSFILVDYPPSEDFDNKEDENKVARARRPYWVHLKPHEVIGWRFSNKKGPPELEHVRVRQYIEEPDGEYGVVYKERVRVYSPGMCKEYIRRYDEKDASVLYTEYPMSIDMIPIIPVFTHRTGLYTAEPPLYDLAILNIRHYQSNSSQDHILDYSRFPVLFGKLIFSETGSETPMGPSSMIHTNNVDADLRYVEHSGAAIKAGAESLKELEDRIAALSHEPLLTRRSGHETATRVAIDSAAASSALQAWALQLKDALEQALVVTAAWAGGDVKQAGSIQMNTDYALTISSTDAANLIQLRQAGELSRTTLWAELSRRGLLGPDFDPETESTDLNTEGAVKDSGEGLLTRMIDKRVLPKELLFNELKRRGAVDPDLEWEEVMTMLQREDVGPAVGFGELGTLDRMLGET